MSDSRGTDQSTAAALVFNDDITEPWLGMLGP
jgi:hypothetical protein